AQREEARRERPGGDGEDVGADALLPARDRLRRLLGAADALAPREPARLAVALDQPALHPRAPLRQRVDDDLFHEVGVGLVEPSLGPHVEVELLAERIRLVLLARGELR